MSIVFKLGKRSNNPSRTYYCKVKNPKTGKWTKKNTGRTDKRAAEARAVELQRLEEQRADGLLDPLTEVPVKEFLADFIGYLTREDTKESYRLQTEGEIIKVVLACAGKPIPPRIDRKAMGELRKRLEGLTLDCVTADRVDLFLERLPSTLAPRTCNAYRTSIVNLFSYLVKKGKMPFNPLTSVNRQDSTPQRKRRALTTEQLQALLNAAKARPLAMAGLIHRGKNKGKPAKVSEQTREKLIRKGHERSLIYITAFYTGFRKNELRTLTVNSLRADKAGPYLYLSSSQTKNGEEAKQPIPNFLDDALRKLSEGKPLASPLFVVSKHDELLKALKKDMAFAGIPLESDERVFDFHALRTSLGTHLRDVGIDPALSQQFMRHSDIKLTMETYNDQSFHDMRGVTDKLPVFTIGEALSNSSRTAVDEFRTETVGS